MFKIVDDYGNVDQKLLTGCITQLKVMRNNNNHSQAIVYGCIMFDLEDLANQASVIEREHLRVGHLEHDLSEKRYKIYTSLLAHAKGILSPEDYKKFYMCF